MSLIAESDEFIRAEYVNKLLYKEELEMLERQDEQIMSPEFQEKKL